MTTRSYAKGQVAVPYYPGTALQESAKFVRLVAFRFLKDNANATDLREACQATIDAIDAHHSSFRPAPDTGGHGQ